MAQAPLTVNTITITAGTAQRLIDDPNSPYAFAKSVIVCPLPDNTGTLFVGDEDVSDSVFAAYCSGTAGTAVVLDGDPVFDSKGNHNNYINLYETWIDGSDNGDVANISILR